MTANFSELVDLASARLGGRVIAANDDFFAPKENLLKSTQPVFLEGKYTDRGKWMDGWETRRRRTPGYDWCLIRLGLPGIIRGVVVDTSHFKGNYPEECSLEACVAPAAASASQLAKASTRWTEILTRSALKGDSQNSFAIAHPERTTHLRLNIFPDGGVARLRVYGEVVPDWRKIQARKAVDLAALVNGGLVLACSDMFFGHRHNLIMPGRARNMSDGWETKRRRGPGHDWAILKLAKPGVIDKIEVDTSHFKGNYPESCSLEGLFSPGASVDELQAKGTRWTELLARTKLKPHKRHSFSPLPKPTFSLTHVRFNIFPDGGVSRLRLYGKVSGTSDE